jgi:gamma-glutamyltranspeptidase
MLAAGGNAIDAAIAACFALTVVEPMMVGILGGGIAHIRLADGRHVVIDNQSMAPLATGPTTYTPDPNAAPGTMDTIGRKNAVGPTAVASPGNLKGWCEALSRFGTFPLADVMEPAVRHASRGFRVTPYLHECVTDCAADMARDAEIAKLYLPGGAPIAAGTRLVTGDYAETLRSIAREGPELLYTGALGTLYAEHMAQSGGYLAREDLTRYRTIDRDALRGSYRGYEIIGPAAALGWTAAHHPNAQHPGRLRHRRTRLRFRWHAASVGRGAEDRVRRPGGGDRGSGVRQGAGREAAVESLRRGAPRAHRHQPRAKLERRGRAWRRGAYHAPDCG